MQSGCGPNSLVDRLKEACLPVCPQMRAARADWLYPVEGYCVLDGPPGYMIPGFDVFRAYCTTGRHCECPWFAPTRPASAAMSEIPHPSRPSLAGFDLLRVAS